MIYSSLFSKKWEAWVDFLHTKNNHMHARCSMHLLAMFTEYCSQRKSSSGAYRACARELAHFIDLETNSLKTIQFLSLFETHEISWRSQGKELHRMIQACKWWHTGVSIFVLPSLCPDFHDDKKNRVQSGTERHQKPDIKNDNVHWKHFHCYKGQKNWTGRQPAQKVRHWWKCYLNYQWYWYLFHVPYLLEFLSLIFQPLEERNIKGCNCGTSQNLVGREKNCRDFKNRWPVRWVHKGQAESRRHLLSSLCDHCGFQRR